MSVSLWRYTEDCNGNPCPGDCDLCDKEPEWIKDPDRPRAMRFKCPYCGGYCYDNFYADRKTIECSYNFCPHCGEEIHIKNEKTKHLKISKGKKQMSKYINADQFERDCMFDRECEDMQDVIYKLRDYPPADVRENIHGEWATICDGLDMVDYHICSLCGHNTYEHYPNFCPNCGANMRGKTDE